jgi:thiamine pyrophosphokinase
MKRALIFANGDIQDGVMVRQALAQAAVPPLVIAADGGARVAWHYERHVDVVVGDMDSLSPDELQTLKAHGAEIQHHPEEKDFTDLELALRYAAGQHCGWMRVIGGIGGRFDQTLANVYLLALPELAGCDVRLASGEQEIRLLRPGTHTIDGQPGDTLSLIPVGGAVTEISTAHLYYPLAGETLEFGPARGVSNVMRGERATVTLGTGQLLLVHTVGRA